MTILKMNISMQQNIIEILRNECGIALPLNFTHYFGIWSFQIYMSQNELIEIVVLNSRKFRNSLLIKSSEIRQKSRKYKSKLFRQKKRIRREK